MRRPVLTLVAIVLAVVVVVLAVRGGSDDEPYRFAAEFDTGRGMVPGQLVKIAGTRVGTIQSVGLTDDNEARMVFEIDPKFGPFHDDATCKILPEGFISENFVDCQPGSPARPELAAADGRDLPLVPLARTEVSVQLQQVLDTFSLPVSQRVRVILNELGIASAGRGRDLNALLRRANPSLGQARKALAELASRKREIASATAQTDKVLAQLSRRDGDVRGFVAKAADVAEITADRRQQLQDTVKSLPPLLRETRGALTSIQTASAQLAPTARSLRKAAPGLTTLNRLVPPVSVSGSDAFNALAPAARDTRKAVVAARPRVQQLTTFAGKSLAPLKSTSELLTSLRDTGGLEYLQNFIYRLAGESSTYDGVSHALTLNLGIQSDCIVNPMAPGCRSTYNSPGRGGIPINAPSIPSAEVSNRTSGANGRGTPSVALRERQADSGLQSTRSLKQLLGVVNELSGEKK